MKRSAIALSSLLLIFTASQANADCNRASTQATTPTSRFAISSDGRTVTDSKTGLVWMRCATGSVWNNTRNECEDNDAITVSRMNWDVALQQAEHHNSQAGGFAGSTHWRLPNIKELASIVEYQCKSPAINQEIFPNIAGDLYWSSTPNRNAGTYYVHFDNGIVGSIHRTESLVRAILVRDRYEQ